MRVTAMVAWKVLTRVFPDATDMETSANPHDQVWANTHREQSSNRERQANDHVESGFHPHKEYVPWPRVRTGKATSSSLSSLARSRSFRRRPSERRSASTSS